MESHGSLRLLLVLLCLALSVDGARLLLATDVSPSLEHSASSRLDLEIIPETPKPTVSSPVPPNVAPTPKSAASSPKPAASSRLAPGISPAAQLSHDVSPVGSPLPFPAEDFSFEGIEEVVVADSPAESAAINEAAELIAELSGPSANKAANEAAMIVAELDIPSSPAGSISKAVSPSAAVALNEAANMAAELDVDTGDIAAAFDSIGDKSSKR